MTGVFQHDRMKCLAEVSTTICELMIDIARALGGAIILRLPAS